MNKALTLGKWKHFFVGILTGVLAQLCLWWILPEQIKLVSIISLTLVMVINYGFDVYSKIVRNGKYDVLNTAAGTIGGVVGMTLILLMQFGI